MSQLKELCRLKEVKVKDNESREFVILALIEKGK